MNKILVVEDEINTSELLRRFFEILGYRVISAHTGADAVTMVEEEMPEVIILDIILPDMNGYEVCKRLRTNSKTRQIPIIFLTQKDERHDRLEGLSLGADDYITKPFDIEELRLRVHNILTRGGGTSFVDPRTGLPNTALMQERLPNMLDDPDMVFLEVRVTHYAEFADRYGPVAANQAIRGVAKLIGDVLHEVDPTRSFLGHLGDDRFLVAAHKDSVERIERELPKRFRKQAPKYYDYDDQEKDQLHAKGKRVSLMSFRVERIQAKALRELTSGKAVKTK